MSIKSDIEKSVRNRMCGGTNAIGTSIGNAKKVGKSTVHVGMKRSRLELLG